MSLNLEFIAYLSLYIFSILFLIIVFLSLFNKLKKFLIGFKKELVDDLDKRFSEYHQKTDDAISIKFLKSKESFDNTSVLQKKILVQLKQFNHYLSSQMIDIITDLTTKIEKRDELESEIIKLKNIIKRLQKKEKTNV